MKSRRMSEQLLVLLALLFNAPVLITGQAPSSARLANPANSHDDVIRVDTNLVTIPTSVMDRGGRYITNLRREDFHIFEDGIEQEVAFFAPVEQPFNILFLLDVSGSMSYRIEDLAQAANAFVDQLRPDDRLSAVSFADSPWELFRPTKVSELRKGIKLSQRPDQHSTRLYDAVDDGLRRMKKIQGRKAIILFSDGSGSGIFSTAKGNLRDAEEQDALIYTVQFNTLSTEAPRYVSQKEYFKRVEGANNYMRDLAQETGGRYYQVESIADLGQTFGQVADELRCQYSLGYYPKTKMEAGQKRWIKVKVPNLVVRARASYIIDKDRVKAK